MSDDISPSEFGLTDSSDEQSGSSTATEQLETGIFGSDSDTTDDDSAVAGIFGTDSGDDGASGPAATEHISAKFSGTQFDAGVATYDSNGDGVADTAVQDHGYQVEYYIDTDGDGQADELTITDEQGDLISHTQLVPGTEATWQETAAPNVAAGDLSVSQNVGPAGYIAPESEASSASPEPATEPSGAGDAASVVATADGAAAPVTAETASPSAAEADPDQATQSQSDEGLVSETVTEGDLALTIDGQTYDVGAPSVDITGDGVADTVVVEQDGNVEYYVDTDGDGVADQIIVLDEANGDLINHEVYDPQTGTWTNVTDQEK